MGLGDAELDDLGAVVVEVALQARLGVDAHVEVVDALGRGRRRPHAQGVEVVGHLALVVVLGQVADGEVHAATMVPDRTGEVAVRDVAVDADQLLLDRLAGGVQVAAVGLRAPAELEVGAQALQAQHRLGVARVAVGAVERVVHGVDRRRDRVGVGALEDQEARDRAARWAARAPRGGRPGSRRRPAAAPAPGPCSDGARRLRDARRQRDAQHAQDHVGRLDAPAGGEEGGGLVAQHRARGQAPEQRAALLDVAVDASTGRRAQTGR